MAQVNLNIHGKAYGVACDDGQEHRVLEVGQVVDAKAGDIAKAGAASNENHLLFLTALMLADELMDLREEIQHVSNGVQQQAAPTQAEAAPIQDEEEILLAIDHLKQRLDTVSERLQGL